MGSVREFFSSSVLRTASASALAAVLVAGVSGASAYAQDRQYDQNRDEQYGDRQQNDRYGRPMSAAEARKVAAINGYAEGYEHGGHDRQGRASFNYKNGDAYREGSGGYDRNFGSERNYQNMFRQGYSKGYSDAYYGRQRNRSYNTRDRGYGQRGGDERYSGRPGSGRDPNGNRGYDNGTYDNGQYRDDREGDLDRQEVARRATQQGYTDGFERGQYDLRIGARQPKPQGHGAYETALNGWDPKWGSAQTFQQSYRQHFIQGYEDGFGRRQRNSQYSRRGW